MPYVPSDFSYRYSDYTETIFLSDIIVEEGAILKTNPAQQYITLKYEDAVRHDRIIFKNDDEKAEQIIQAKEQFRSYLAYVFYKIIVIPPYTSPAAYGVYITMDVKPPYIGYAILQYVESENIENIIKTKMIYEMEVGVWVDGNSYYYDQRTIFEARKAFRNWIISQQK